MLCLTTEITLTWSLKPVGKTTARREFSAELDKLHSSAQLAEERYSTSEKRALLEIDRERTLAAKLQKELDATRTSAVQAADRQRADVAALQVQLGELQQRTGVLEGSLQAAKASKVQVTSELESVRVQLAEIIGQESATRVKAENWRQEAEAAQRALAEVRAKMKSTAPKAKSRAKMS